jgi:hypothetical protein
MKSEEAVPCVAERITYRNQKGKRNRGRSFGGSIPKG